MADPMKPTAFLLFLLCMMLAPLSAFPEEAKARSPQDVVSGQTYLLSQSWWRDSGGQASFDEARTQDYRPYEGLFSKGYSPAVDWIRLRIAASDTGLRLLLSPPWLDQITLFDPNTGAAPRTLGDHYPPSSRRFHGVGFSFDLAPSDQPRDLWLRLQTSSAHLLLADVVALEQLDWVMAGSIVEPSVYITLMLILFFILLASWWLQRDRVIAAYLMRHLAVAYYICGFYGLPTLWLSDWLPPLFFDKAFSMSVLLVLPLAVRFDQAILTSYRPHRTLLWLVKSLPWVSLFLLLPFVLGMESLALQLNSLLLLAFACIVFAASLSCRPPESVELLLPKRALVLYYFLVMGGLLIGLSTVIGILPPKPWALNLLVWHNLVTAVLMTIFLFVRGQRWVGESRRAHWMLRLTQNSLQLEQRRRKEASMFLHMLMHELKTPLAVVTLALGARQGREQKLGQAREEVRNMKAILERCLQLDQLHEGLDDKPLQLRLETLDVVELVRHLAQAMPELNRRLRLAAQPLEICSDRQLLGIILGNLLGNAALYSAPATPIALTIKKEVKQGRAGLWLRLDNRPGIAGWPDAERVFDTYYRAPGAKAMSGSGLGLPLALQLAQNLGGTLRYCPTATEIGFELWLPDP